MIRSDLIARIAEQNPHLYARNVERVVNAILDRITDALADRDRVGPQSFATLLKLRAELRRNLVQEAQAQKQAPQAQEVSPTPKAARPRHVT
jgi:hypothetical protein